MIIQVIQPLDIKREAFEMYEYKLAKEVINECKSCGVEDIRPEVLKRSNIDEIIIYFCNSIRSNEATIMVYFEYNYNTQERRY